eukprot:snap_masked-scaffold_4-processed-gene-18.39-mRNA-1 protein AED:1.00 eAED:1.00 QI:0/-1/0/0/-1/1/1/0/411
MNKLREAFSGGFCSNLALVSLISVNLILLLVSLTLIGLSSYGLKNFSEFDDLVSTNSFIYLLCGGLMLFIFSILAIFGGISDNKFILKIYLFFLILIISAQVIGAFFLLVYVGVIDSINNSTDTISLDRQTVTISNYLLRSYSTCCVLDSDFCSTSQVAENFCLSVTLCSLDDDGVCFDGSQGSLEREVDASVCSALERLDVVGDSLNEKCGSGNPTQFLSDVVELITSNLGSLAYIGIAIGGIEFLLVVFVIYLIFGKDSRLDFDGLRGRNDREILQAVPVTTHTSVGRGLSSVGNLAERNRLSQRLTVTSSTRNNRISGRLGSGDGSSTHLSRRGNQSLITLNEGNRIMRGDGGSSTRLRAGSIDSVQESNIAVPLRVNGENKPARSVVRSSIPRKKLEEDPDIINSVL